MSPLRNQLSNSLRSSLANPNPYNSDTVRSIDSALTGQLNQDFGAKRKMLEEDLARRGLSASTFGGGYYGDLQGQEDQALATMRAGLTQSAANAEIAGRTQAQGAAQANINAENSQGLSQQQLDLSRELGLGNLSVSQGGLDLARSGQNIQQSQFGQTLGLSQQQQDLARQLGLGNLDLARTGQAQEYGLAKNAQDIQQQQFGQTFGLSQQQQDLARQLGLGNLDLSNRQLTQQGSQFGQDLALRKESQADTRSQFAQQLAQQLGIATMGDKTANRGIDANSSQQQLDYLLRLAGITGIGGLGGASGGTGGTGGSSGGSTGGSGGTSNYWDVPAGEKPTADQFTQAYQAMNPGKPVPYPGSREAQDWIATHPPSTWKPTNTTTVNFAGKQYTQPEWDAYTKQNPNWWQGASSQDLSSLRTAPQNFYDPSIAHGYSGTPVPNNSPFDQAYFDSHTPEQINTDTNAYNFNTAKNDASSQLDYFLRNNGAFTDTARGNLGGSQDYRQGMQSTSQWITDQLRKMGYNLDGTRIPS